MIHLILAASLASQAPTAPAPEAAAPRLTLRAALERALKVSPSAIRADDEIEAAEAQRVATKSLVLPRLSLSASLIRNSEEVAFGSGDDSRVILPGSDWSTRLTLQQPVYAGRREFRLYYQSKEAVTLARDGKRGNRDRLALRVISDYAQAVQASALADVARQSAALAEKRIAQAQALFEAGEVTRVDVLRAQTAHKGALRLVALAEADGIQARSRLRTTLAIDGGDAELGALDTATELGIPVPSADALDRLALDRAEIKQAETNVRIADLELLKQKGAYFPVVTADLGYLKQKSSFPSDGYGYAALRFTVPIFQGGEVGAKMRIASARKHQAEVTLAEAKRQATEDIRQALAMLEAARRARALADDQVKAAEAEYAEARDLYEQREATALDLQAAESALGEARRSLIEAKFDVLRGEAMAWLAAGSLADAALENFK
ncbi:MAG: TolC family protein [Vicinamibacteria bacterium]|nr:TolC family protein [Vicinamibacteria bacterium]